MNMIGVREILALFKPNILLLGGKQNSKRCLQTVRNTPSQFHSLCESTHYEDCFLGFSSGWGG